MHTDRGEGAARRFVRLRAPVARCDELSGAGGVLRHHGHDLAELAVCQTVSHFDDRRMEAAIEADREHDTSFPGRIDDGPSARQVEREWLLDVDVLVRGGGLHYLFGMLAVRCCQHDGVDVRIRQYFGVAVDQRNIFFAAELLGA